MCRRIVGIAHVEDFESIEDAGKRASCERRALDCAKSILKGRRQFESIEQVIVHIKSATHDWEDQQIIWHFRYRRRIFVRYHDAPFTLEYWRIVCYKALFAGYLCFRYWDREEISLWRSLSRPELCTTRLKPSSIAVSWIMECTRYLDVYIHIDTGVCITITNKTLFC